MHAAHFRQSGQPHPPPLRPRPEPVKRNEIGRIDGPRLYRQFRRLYLIDQILLLLLVRVPLFLDQTQRQLGRLHRL